MTRPTPEPAPLKAAIEHYATGIERGRLLRGPGLVEFRRTQEIIDRRLPSPPAMVADVGGGPGEYASWLAERGYQVRLRDLVPSHVDHARTLAPGATGSIDAEVGDARELDFADASIDAVLLLGPIHHLIRRRDRLAALAEARRVVRPGGPVFIAAISRWAPLLHGILVKRTDLNYPEARDLVKRVIRTGVLPPLFPGDFTAYVHRPNQLRAEVRAAGLELIDLVSVEGLAFALPANDSDIELLIDAARQTERIPELMGLSPHMLLTARRGVTPC